MPVRQRLVTGAAITAAVQCQSALIDNGAVTGWRPRLDLPGHRLARVKSERVKIKDANVRLVTPVGHRGRGIVDLHRAVVTVHCGRGLTVTRRSRHWPRARAGRPERQSHAGRAQRRTGDEGEISTPGNKGHSMPPLLDKLGLCQDKRRGPGNCYTPPPSDSAQALHRLSQSPARRLSRPAWPNLPGLVIPETVAPVPRRRGGLPGGGMSSPPRHGASRRPSRREADPGG
jgi:hypothetical protein